MHLREVGRRSGAESVVLSGKEYSRIEELSRQADLQIVLNKTEDGARQCT